MISLKGKIALVMGAANAKSIALHIGRTLKKAGARVIYTYEGERTRIAVRTVTDADDLLIPCNVLQENELQVLQEKLSVDKITLDVLVHSIAYAPPASLEHVEKTTQADFNLAMDVSAHSLIAATNALTSHFNTHASILTMSYIGSLRAMKTYGMMGIAKAALESSVRYLAATYGKSEKQIRVNAISAGPLKTTSAMAVPGYQDLYETYASNSALGRNITHEEVANTALFLASPLSSGITGQVIYVDAGFSIT